MSQRTGERTRGDQDWSLSRRDAHEADGHRGALPQAEHLKTRPRAQDLPVPAARDDHRPPQPGLGHGHHLRAPGAWLRLPGRYLAAVVDWFSRRVLSWRVSISLEAAFCVEALEEALARHGRPEVFNTDQG